MRLTGKKVVVVGGASGIGLAAAQMALAEGASVTIGDISAENISRAKTKLDGKANVNIVEMDVTDQAAVESLFAGMNEVDHIFLTAGILDRENSGALNAPIDSLWKIVDTRIMGVTYVARAAQSKFAQGGSLTLTSGLDGARPAKNSTLAAAAVEGVKGMVRGLALDLKPIRVNCVVPGLIDTPLWTSYPNFNKMAAEFTKNLPVPRVGQAEDVADAAIFLMTNGYINGVSIDVDGGAQLI